MKPTNISTPLLVITLVCTSLGFGQSQPVKPPTRDDLIRQRMEWFYRQRAYPLKHIPPGARLRALKQMDQMLAEEGRSSAPSTDVSSEPGFDLSSAAISSTRWALIGPEPTDTPYNVPVVAGALRPWRLILLIPTSYTRVPPEEEYGKRQMAVSTGLR